MFFFKFFKNVQYDLYCHDQMIFIIIMFFTIILHRYLLYHGPYILKKCSSHAST